jgi:hypothetical protein
MKMVKQLRKMGATHIQVGEIRVSFEAGGSSIRMRGSSTVEDLTLDSSPEVNRLQSQVDREKLLFWSAT